MALSVLPPVSLPKLTTYICLLYFLVFSPKDQSDSSCRLEGSLELVCVIGGEREEGRNDSNSRFMRVWHTATSASIQQYHHHSRTPHHDFLGIYLLFSYIIDALRVPALVRHSLSFSLYLFCLRSCTDTFSFRYLFSSSRFLFHSLNNIETRHSDEKGREQARPSSSQHHRCKPSTTTTTARHRPLQSCLSVLCVTSSSFLHLHV